MKNTVTNNVARICDRKSCVRERISRNVQMMRLSQKITTKATIKPITTPSELVRLDSVLLVDEVVAVDVAVAVGVAVGAIPVNGFVFSIAIICVIVVIVGVAPLSGNPLFGTLNYNVSYGKMATL